MILICIMYQLLVKGVTQHLTLFQSWWLLYYVAVMTLNTYRSKELRLTLVNENARWKRVVMADFRSVRDY